MTTLHKSVSFAGLAAVVLVVTGCSTAAVGVSALGAVAETVAGKSYAGESRRRAESQSEMRAYEEAQAPEHVESASAYLSVVEQMQKQGLWFASLAHIDALEARWKPSDASRLLRADALRQVGERSASEALYLQLLQGPLSARAWHGRGLLAAMDGRFEIAVQHMRSAQLRSPTDALLLSDLGYALLNTAHGLQAGLPLKQAAQLMPQNTRIQSNLALYLLLYGQEHEALSWMNEHRMTQEQRLQVFETAQRISAGAPLPMEVQGISAAQPSGLIFENRMLSAVPAAL